MHHAPADPSRAYSSTDESDHSAPLSIRLGVGARCPPSVAVSAGEHAPAALAFAAASALQAMMLGLAATSSEEGKLVFWKVRRSGNAEMISTGRTMKSYIKDRVMESIDCLIDR